MLEHFRDHDNVLKPDAVMALASVRGNLAAAIPELTAILADTDPPCPCQTAAELLGTIGPAARDAVPHLIRMARFGCNYYDRPAARRALERIDLDAARATSDYSLAALARDP